MPSLTYDRVAHCKSHAAFFLAHCLTLPLRVRKIQVVQLQLRDTSHLVVEIKMVSSSLTSVTFLTILLLACFCAAENSSSYSMDVGKRGGARAFRGFFNGHSAKRISEFFPYYLYDKRGGGRAFVGGWQPYEGFGRRFYDSVPFYKRSSNLWEFLEGRNNF
ncbi:hypothetical protein Angca_000757 [Angiostrongylus cantonensis]|nr:hypothetical protein Angca_000757 [Angiostrongylus cantonensis]